MARRRCQASVSVHLYSPGPYDAMYMCLVGILTAWCTWCLPHWPALCLLLCRFMNIFISTWVLLVAGLVFALPMIHMRVKDTTDEANDMCVSVHLVVIFFSFPFFCFGSPVGASGLRGRASFCFHSHGLDLEADNHPWLSAITRKSQIYRGIHGWAYRCLRSCVDSTAILSHVFTLSLLCY